MELMFFALNEDQPELYKKGKPAESVWDASHLQATGTESAFTHITTHYLPSQAPNLTSAEAEAKCTSKRPSWVIRIQRPVALAPYRLCSLI